MRMRPLTGVVLISLGTAACDGGGQPEPAPLPNETCIGPFVQLDPILAEIAVGDSVALTARRRSFISVCSPQAPGVFQWQTQVPGVVSLRPTGDSTAIVKGVAPGTVLVFATVIGYPLHGALSTLMEIRVRN